MRSQPLYKQVKEQIVESLARNDWRPGELIPSEKQLASRFGVGISTVRAAIGELAASRVLIRSQGKGTYVAHHNARGSIYRFFNVVSNGGEKEPFHRELLSIRRERADAGVAARLHLPAARGSDVYRLKIRLSASFPRFAYAEIVVPARLFPGLDARTVPDGAASLYALYQAKYGVNIVRVDENLYAVRAGAVVARALGVKRDEPVLQIERLGYTFNDTPVELRTTWVHTSHYHYFITQGAAG
ncbi:MAG TPA: GntR family transcriptional regulator [Casimicrobiaceae bacterium]|nr:GntR family transcriptional regulator [Casimicrobiaceae bacterium]